MTWTNPKAKRWQDAELYEVYWSGRLPRSGYRKTWVLLNVSGFGYVKQVKYTMIYIKWHSQSLNLCHIGLTKNGKSNVKIGKKETLNQ